MGFYAFSDKVGVIVRRGPGRVQDVERFVSGIGKPLGHSLLSGSSSFLDSGEWFT
jgi:hypothetical protein